MSEEPLKVESEESHDVLPGYLGSTPPPGKLPRKGERLWVERPEQLSNAVHVLKRSKVVAIDAEFTQSQTRTANEPGRNVPRLSLLQLAIDGCCFVVDALRLRDLLPLQEIVGNPEVAVLLHGAGADLKVMAERGLIVAHYYDLEATCRSIFGQHESSLAAMLQRAFHMRLDKSLQRTDWKRRPLPPAMIAYAARDAEVTLSLYYWLDRYYHDILQLQEVDGNFEPVAGWIEPFLRGGSNQSPEMAVAEARAQGLIRNKVQIVSDCRAALATLKHPMRKSRMLRLIADLGLKELAPDLLPLLQAVTSDERAAAARALGRLDIKSARAAISPLLEDPVQDVRKSAVTALRNLNEKNTLSQAHNQPTRSADGSRSWSIGEQEPGSSNDNDWKTRLRSIIE